MYVFSSLEFLFRFLPVFLILYYLCPDRFRNALLFGGSIIFYASGAKWFVLLLLALTGLNWFLGNYTWVRPGRKPNRKSVAGMVLSGGIDAATLVVFKMLALFVDSSLLPLGISFYIFKMISYQADLFMGQMKHRPKFIETATYFTMFPQITEGPIMRFKEGLFGTGEPRKVTIRRFSDGIFFLVMGLGMKVLIADRIGILWNELTKIGYQSISTPLAWIGAFAYSFQLYFDFWGYSLMASGVAMMLGFPFILNFIHPYAADGVADFYRRWHATLGSWFKDYIYIPMGGSRRKTGRVIFNLMVVWALTGFWHGGTVNFIIWGLVLGLLIVWEKFVVKGLMKRYPVIGHLHVWILIPLTWVIFAISNLRQLGIYFTRLFPFFGTGVAVNHTDFVRYLGTYWPLFAVSIALCFPAVYRFLVKNRRKWPVVILFAAIFWVSVYYIVVSSSNTFMYFSF